MSIIGRWRLGCFPEADDCVFVVTSQGEMSKFIRFDCIKHYGGFIVTPATKTGKLKFERVDHISSPLEKSESAQRKALVSASPSFEGASR